MFIHLHIRKQVNIKVKNPEFIEYFLSVLLMDNVNKKEFATIFTKNYASIVKDFIEVRIILYLYSQSFMFMWGKQYLYVFKLPFT